MNILITGSEGSLAQALIPHLFKHGHNVVGVDNLFKTKKQSNKTNEYVFLNADLNNQKELNGIFENDGPFNCIIHCAAHIWGVGGFNEYCADILGRDIEMTANLLERVKGFIPTFVYISSSMVYETVEQNIDLAMREEYTEGCIVPKTDYGLSKLTNERLVRSYHKQYGVPFTIWRPFNIITPFERSTGNIGQAHVFADFIHKIVVEKVEVLPIIGDGNQIRCFTWIDDVAEGIVRGLKKPLTTNEVFNIGNPEPVSMKQLAKLIAKIANQKGLRNNSDIDFRTVVEYPNDVRVRIPDITKVNKIGWEPTVNLEESINKCIDKIAELNL